MKNCQPYLVREIELIQPKVFVALGRIAFDAILRIFTANADISSTVIRPSPAIFAHNAAFRLNADPLKPEHWLLASYHPSRQNTQTGRLTVEMFDQVWKTARELMEN
jgi:uracil-DNA glycosylase family 4